MASLLTNWQDESLIKKFEILSRESKEFYLNSEVPEIDLPIEPLTFYREWISSNKPVIIKNAIKHWPALSNWKSENYLRNKIGDEIVTVAVTPTGYADAPEGDLFVLPEEVEMAFSKFLDIMAKPQAFNGIHYIQKQSSNMVDEFSHLLDDVDEHIPWFSEALKKVPDAQNFWIGDNRAITSMHKDNYENIYCVVSGHKDFTLIPPTDLPWIPHKLYPQAKYCLKEDTFRIDTLPNQLKVPWICVDPTNPDLDSYPLFKNASVIACRVQAGDALYLPSLWYHHVRQSHACIAVNYWYDMEYDIKYNYHQFLQNLS